MAFNAFSSNQTFILEILEWNAIVYLAQDFAEVWGIEYIYFGRYKSSHKMVSDDNRSTSMSKRTTMENICSSVSTAAFAEARKTGTQKH